MVTMPQRSTRAAYRAMLPHATDWHRGSSVVAGRLRSVGGIRPAQTEMNPARVDPRESMQKTGRGWIGAGGYKEGSRGAVLVPSTCGWDILAGAVVRRIQTSHSHLRSRVSVGLEAPKGNQRGQQSGRGERSRPSATMFGPRMRRLALKSLLTRPRPGGLRQAAAGPLPATSPFFCLRRNDKECREADLRCLGGA